MTLCPLPPTACSGPWAAGLAWRGGEGGQGKGEVAGLGERRWVEKREQEVGKREYNGCPLANGCSILLCVWPFPFYSFG